MRVCPYLYWLAYDTDNASYFVPPELVNTYRAGSSGEPFRRFRNSIFNNSHLNQNARRKGWRVVSGTLKEWEALLNLHLQD